MKAFVRVSSHWLAAALLTAASLAGWSRPPSSATAAPDPIVYDDDLHWDNWSWGTTVNARLASPVYLGAKSMSVTYSRAWAGLSLHTAGFATSGYGQLHFALRPNGTALPAVQVSLYDATGKLIRPVSLAAYAKADPSGWYVVDIPLTDLGAANMTITRVQLQEGSGTAQPTYYVDDMRFIADAPPPAPTSVYVYDDSLHWDNWSWGGTFNPSSQAPVYMGTKSLSVFFNKPWAGLQLHDNGFGTSPYTHMEFVISPNGNPLPALSIGLYDASGSLIKTVDMAAYAHPVSAGWWWVSIPLADLVGASRTVTRVLVQEGAGVVPPVFYIDGLRFTSTPVGGA